MAEASFSVMYDGPALQEGRIPVGDLAPALLALGEVFDAAAADLYPELPAPTLEVEAPERGSFDAHLILHAVDAWEQAVDMFSSKEITALANLVQLTTGAAGLFALIRKLRGRRIREVENTNDPDEVIVTLDDGVEFVAATKLVRISRNPKARRAARQVVEPVKRLGINKVEIRSDDSQEEDEPVVVESSEAEAFELPTAEDGSEEVVDNVREAFVTIVKPDFEDGRWKVSDGSSRFGVEMEDQGFQDRVRRAAEVFRAGDTLRCIIRTSQWIVDGKLRSVHKITEVIEHVKAGEQLDFDSGDQGGPA
jgi:hypothetical protein